MSYKETIAEMITKCVRLIDPGLLSVSEYYDTLRETLVRVYGKEGMGGRLGRDPR
jgi:hypothetical protein